MKTTDKDKIIALCDLYGIPPECIWLWDNGEISIEHPLANEVVPQLSYEIQ